MPIRKIDGRDFLDAGIVIVEDNAVIEIEVVRHGQSHQVALKFRSDGTEPNIRFGNPSPDRTVVHLANLTTDSVAANGGMHVGKIGADDLLLAFSAEPIPLKPALIWQLTYTLYARSGS